MRRSSLCEDADLDVAVEGALVAQMRNMGEACTAANRFYVHGSVHDQLWRTDRQDGGASDGQQSLEEGVVLGPLVNHEGATRSSVGRYAVSKEPG